MKRALCALLVLLLAPTATAAAKGDHFVQPAHFSAVMSLPASHGYKVTLRSFGHRLVYLSASKGAVSASYTVRGRASSDGIEADFGDLGRIAVRFDGVRRRPEAGPFGLIECKGKRLIYEVGDYSGKIRFQGELGFTAVSAGHAKGYFVHGFRRVCKKPPWLQRGGRRRLLGSRPSGGFSVSLLAAASKTPDRALILEAAQAEAQADEAETAEELSIVIASSLEHANGIWIDRRAFVFGSGRPVLVASEPDANPTTATLRPGKPFGGTGTFSRSPGSEPTWTGPLSAWLPGLERVALTGPDFKAAFCLGENRKKLRRCLADVTEESGPDASSLLTGPGATVRPLWPAAARDYGSGSHSQAFWDARLSWSR